MKRLLCLSVFSLCAMMPLCAQSSSSDRLIKELERQRGILQKQIAETEKLLTSTKKDVGSQLNGLASITGQIEERKRYILVLNKDMAAIDGELTKLERQLSTLEKELQGKKKEYAASVQYLYNNRSAYNKLLFILSAKTISQTYRRMRYVREYGDYQRQQGEEVMQKQKQVNQKKTELAKARSAKEKVRTEREKERNKLMAEEKSKRSIVTSLQKKQQGLQKEINQKRREANQLNQRIDKIVADEIEKSRKRAADEARKESKKTTDGKKAAPLEKYTLSKADRELSGNFTGNRGKLPMPITGAYIITSRYGQYSVEGLRNVKLDNKGIDIQGRPGSQARAIFNGKVAAVFKLNGLFNILIRHGNYISVYCNLSSATVKQGDDVTTRQTIGQVFSDKADGGRTVLHFQLRREKEKLNPEPWLDK
ncbi:MAG: peptidoglycan DD-metalloendopeptidase family protein [Mediterranea sp.]|nr:peptidoglycan DD-metalloendopeptidase family protein [Mediterranea sp.]